MGKLDIRNNSTDAIDVIVFANDNYAFGTQLKNGYGGVRIEDYEGDLAGVEPENIPNLILALQKAVELGWT